MTLKASWFNVGIYKNALRRFKWGSVLYFVMLFFMVPFMFFVGEFGYNFYIDPSVTPQAILETDCIVFPLLTAYAVSIVVAVIMHRYMHESRQAIAIHSMPVTRTENYISNLLAGFTLMAVPVVANGFILLLMTCGEFGEFFTPITVLYWVALNLSVLFIMFSVSTFAAFLTGHAAAHIGITVLLHTLPAIFALGIAFISEVFVYGFAEAENSVATMLLENTPFVWIFTRVTSSPFVHGFFGKKQFVLYMLMAIVLYITAYFVYKHRRVESCGDVAAFKAVRYILKYGLTAAVMLVVSAIAYEGNFGFVTVLLINIVLGGIAYFASEMVLSKNLRVFGKYKGFIGFCATMAVFVSFFAFTSVFGYETRVPKAEDIKTAAIAAEYEELIPYVDDADFVRHVADIHKELIKDRKLINPEQSASGWYQHIGVYYNLKNGKKLERQYLVSGEQYKVIMASMYENETYKYKALNLYYLDDEALDGLMVKTNIEGEGQVYSFYCSNESAREILKAYKEDVKEKSYSDISMSDTGIWFEIEIITRDENGDFIEGVVTAEGIEQYEYVPYDFAFTFNVNYENTMAKLKELGCYDEVISIIGGNYYICPIPAKVEVKKNQDKSETSVSYKDDVGYAEEFNVKLSDCVKLEESDGLLLAEEMLSKNMFKFEKDGKYYLIYYFREFDDDNVVPLNQRVAVVNADSVPEYLKKYVE